MEIPQVLIMGATGRIGMILRECWPMGPGLGQTLGSALWQARRSENRSENGPENWVMLDPLTEPEALVRAATGRAVILCLSGVVPGRGGKDADLADNTRLAEAAIRAAHAVGARVILASSAAVYGGQPGVLAESAPLVPVTDYGRAKVAMEVRADALAAELGVPVTCLRIGNIAGIDAILGGWRPGFQLDQFDDGRTPQRSYIGMATLGRVLGDLVAAQNLPKTLNIANPGTVEMGALLDAAGLAWTSRPAPDTAIARVCLSTRALARFTALAETDGTDGMADALVAEWRALKGPRK